MQYIKPRLLLFCLFSLNLHGNLPESLYSLNIQLEKIANSIKQSKRQAHPSPKASAKHTQAKSKTEPNEKLTETPAVQRLQIQNQLMQDLKDRKTPQTNRSSSERGTGEA